MIGAKVAAWSCIAVGGALSLAANLAYAYLDGKHPSRQDVFMAVVWPVLLYGALEMFIRIPWPNTVLGWFFRLLATGLVGAVALVTSYGHMHDVLKGANDHPFARIMGPIAIDGLMVSAAAGLVAIKVAEAALLAVANSKPEPASLESAPATTTQPAVDEPRTSPAPTAITDGASTPPSDASGQPRRQEAGPESAPVRSRARTPAPSGGGPAEDLLVSFRSVAKDLKAAGRVLNYRNVAPALRERGHKAGRAKVEGLIAEHDKPQLHAVV